MPNLYKEFSTWNEWTLSWSSPYTTAVLYAMAGGVSFGFRFVSVYMEPYRNCRLSLEFLWFGLDLQLSLDR
jgi:hypothetical protein